MPDTGASTQPPVRLEEAHCEHFQNDHDRVKPRACKSGLRGSKGSVQ